MLFNMDVCGAKQIVDSGHEVLNGYDTVKT